LKPSVILFFTILVLHPALGQTKSHTPTTPSHRSQVLRRVNLLQVQFKVSCARTANRADNQKCTNQILRELQDTYNKLSLSEIPVPASFSPTQVVLVFKEDVLVDDDTVSLTVYETENNDELYSDSRNRLILSNDLTKLLAGYVETLKSE
jgi:hypothetical protein